MNPDGAEGARRSPLEATVRGRGAVLGLYEGCLLAEKFAGVEAEHAAASRTVGVIDQSYRGLLSARGRGAGGFLQRLVTSNVNALADGEGQPSCFLSPKGKLLAAFHLFRRSEEDFLAIFPGPIPPEAQRTLSRYAFLEDLAVAEEGESRRILTVQGPHAAACVREALKGREAPARGWFREAASFGAAEVFLRRESRTVGGGISLEVPCAALAEVWEALVSAAESGGGGPAGFAAEEILRIEAGIPRWGVDFDGANFPNESGWDDAINYQKGCYLGQEVMARMRTYGHTNRRLLHLKRPAGLPLDRGMKLYHRGKEAGQVTSAATSPATGLTTGLGYLRPVAWNPGTRVAAGSPEGPEDVEVLPRPEIEPPAPGQEN